MKDLFEDGDIVITKAGNKKEHFDGQEAKIVRKRAKQVIAIIYYSLFIILLVYYLLVLCY